MQLEILTGAAAFAAALIALSVYHLAVLRPALERHGAALRTHDEMLGGGGGAASTRLQALETACDELRGRAERAETLLRELDARSQTDIARAGFVRYDAFDNTGSQLSYALALLNRAGDGVVLSSIYSREDVRTYGKAVQGWKPLANASAEELAAIERAREAAILR